jgi:hypothetical protein
LAIDRDFYYPNAFQSGLQGYRSEAVISEELIVRNLKQIFILLVLAGLVAVGPQSGHGQSDKPNLSGEWTRDNAKSSGLQGVLATVELTLLITHKDPEFRISRSVKLKEQQMTQDLVYYTDHRGETNPATIGSGDVKSKTKWNKNKIETTASWSRMGRTGDVSNFDSTEKWDLSADGKTLTDSVDISTPNGMRSIKQVFNRK